MTNELEAKKIYDQTQNDPSASYWIKDAMASLSRRDPVDAIADVEALRNWLLLQNII